MTARAAVAAAVGRVLRDPVTEASAVGGGSINDAWLFTLGSGARAFVKSRPDAPPAEFKAEASGLRWLAEAGARVPEVLGVGEEPAWLALEWIEPGALSAAGAEGLGRQLAALHRCGAPAHGALPPGSPDAVLRVGSIELAAGDVAEWPALYANGRLLALLGRARDAGSITARDAAAIERVCDRIDELVGPPEPPARLHGDLWSGNVHADAGGRAWLIDPAAHGGHREVDLAMLRLFGTPSERLFAAYHEAYPLADGHTERVALWQLFPLLAHAVLFGGSYGAAAGEAARRYV